MAQKRDGGPAFARAAFANETYDQFNDDGHRGMSLRDYFAAAALMNLAGQYAPGDDGTPAEQRTAEHCYKLADAMLAARSKE